MTTEGTDGRGPFPPEGHRLGRDAPGALVDVDADASGTVLAPAGPWHRASILDGPVAAT